MTWYFKSMVLEKTMDKGQEVRYFREKHFTHVLSAAVDVLGADKVDDGLPLKLEDEVAAAFASS